MKHLYKYKNFQMYLTKSGIEFWQNNRAESKIARVVTATKSEDEAKKYLDKLISSNNINNFYA